MSGTPSDQLERFRAAVEEHLRPMLPGANVGPVGTDLNHSRKWSSLEAGAASFKLRPELATQSYLTLSRIQKFYAGDLVVAEAFAQEFDLVEKSGVSDTLLRETLIAAIGQRVAVRIAAKAGALNHDEARVLAHQLSLLRSWASQTYEGQPIASGLAIDLSGTATTDAPSLTEYAKLPAAMVLGDGVTSFQAFDGSGKMAGFECLDEPDETGADTFRYPHVFRRAARWTVAGKRTVACLTRRGETLVFAGGAMHFANRRGTWFHANHDGAIATWTKVHDMSLRRAVYATALDASFSRTGACIAILNRASMSLALRDDKIVQPTDLINGVHSGAKGAAFAGIIGSKRFQDLPREIRRQLVAVDGATVLAPDGKVLAVGAIVSVPGGSDGGGRLAATRALAAYGFAVKVSADGQIRAYQVDSLTDPVFVGL